jgi:hypothetical protein
MLISGTMFFINGLRADVPAAARGAARRLADARALGPGALPAALEALAHEWYRQGYLHIEGDRP